MKKGLFVAAVWMVCAGRAWAGEYAWEELSGVPSCYSVQEDKDSSRRVLAGAAGGVYLSEDAGIGFRQVLRISGSSDKDIRVQQDPFDLRVWYAATGSGLYRSTDSGRSWQRIFKGEADGSGRVNSAGVVPGFLYAATDAGLFLSRDGGRRWQREAGAIGTLPVIAVAGSLEAGTAILWAVAAGELYVCTAPGAGWSCVKHREESSPWIEDLVPGKGLGVYAATSRGVFLAEAAGGIKFQRLAVYGLFSLEMRRVSFDKAQDTLYACTGSSVFVYDRERWKEISFELQAGEVRGISAASSFAVYVAGSKGLFKASIVPETFRGEISAQDPVPGIGEVQQAAIAYAQVDPEMVARWRRQASAKAWMPQLSVSFARNTSDLWHWESGSTTKSCDDALMRGRDSLDWDVRVSWDLAEVVWNKDQASIDARARLLSDLREHLLEEVAAGSRGSHPGGQGGKEGGAGA
jgi:photosystem II stability/assembly factor-like uncharacterized protein